MAEEKRVVVIGTGAGGLVTAASLAKQGAEVVALERSPYLGGYLNSFQRKGYHFDPGVHYVGECREGEAMDRILGELGLDVTELFCEMDRDGFDRYRFPDLEIAWCAGMEAWQDRLKETFPKEKKGIDRYFSIMRVFEKVLPVLGDLFVRGVDVKDAKLLPQVPVFLRWGLRSFDKLLRSCTGDERLRAVLGGSFGCLGLPPSEVSVLVGMGLVLHFMEGAFFPRGGSGALRDALVKVGEDHGATYRTRSEVKRIVLEDGAAKGVALQDGEWIEADAVVAAIEPARTFGELIPLHELPAKLRNKVAGLQPSLGSFYCFLGMKRDLREHGLGAFNQWDYATYDLDGTYEEARAGRWAPAKGVIASPNSLKDDTGSLAPEGCSTLEVLTFAPHAPFARWEGMKPGKRGQDYDDLKKRIGDELLAFHEERNPGLVGDVEIHEYATPLSNTAWVNAIEGGAYGPAMTRAQTGPYRFTPATPIGNLYLAGSGVFGAGVVTCLLSGRAAARKVLA